MEEEVENDEDDDEVDGGMKKLDLQIFGQNISPKIVVQNEG